MSDVVIRETERVMVGFAPVPVLRPREQVEAQIREAILSGQLVVGERLPSEAVLAAEFSVSRTTVREALRTLAANGLISKVPGSGGGSFVRSVDQWSLGHVVRDGIQNLLELGTIEADETIDMRYMLEVPAARLAAQNCTAADAQVLDRIVGELAVVSYDDPSVPAMDAQLHTTVALTSRNRILASLVYALHTATQPVRQLGLTSETGRHSHRQHQRLVDAIKAGDPELAGQAMIDHLSYLKEHPKQPPTSSMYDAAVRSVPGPVLLD
jgi:GntR family transcriptional repressor for pyruvate dehydrogenase complex